MDLSVVKYRCKICGIPDHELAYNIFEEISCEPCWKWFDENIIPFVREKLLTACGGDMNYVYLLATTDEIEREMHC